MQSFDINYEFSSIFVDIPLFPRVDLKRLRSLFKSVNSAGQCFSRMCCKEIRRFSFAVLAVTGTGEFAFLSYKNIEFTFNFISVQIITFFERKRLVSGTESVTQFITLYFRF